MPDENYRLVSRLWIGRDILSCLKPKRTINTKRVCCEECEQAGYQNSDAPPRPPMVTSMTPSPFRSMTPWMD